MEDAHDGRLLEPHDDAVRQCRDRRQAPWLSRQGTLAEEIPLAVNGDDGFLALVGDDGDLDLAVLDIKDGFRRISLGEDDLAFPIFRQGPPAIHGGEKELGVESPLPFCRHRYAFMPVPIIG